MDAMALSAALARPWADVVLSGAATPDQLHSKLCTLTCLAMRIVRPQIWTAGHVSPTLRSGTTA